MDFLNPYRRVAAFLLPYFIGAAVFALGVAVAHKPTLHEQLRSVHGATGDLFFRNCTHLGEWYAVAALLVVFLVLRRWRTCAALALAFAAASVIAQGLKHLVKAPRPWRYFENLHDQFPFQAKAKLWLADGVNLADKTSPSFPSGHATTAFVLFLGLAFLVGKSRINETLAALIQIVCLCAAALVAYSRIYLSYHFAEDVLVGSFIGVLAICAAFPLLDYLWERFSLPLGKDSNPTED